MLKGKRSVSACSLSSCRITAEALARAFNNRIWPCAWISQRSAVEGGDGMSKGIDEEEQFFDASPSPVEVEDESLFCQHRSAATEAGRAKLYELLQQHATDDAIDVFYDAGEDANQVESAGNTCLDDTQKGSSCALYNSPRCSSDMVDEAYFYSDSKNIENAKLFFSNNSERVDTITKQEKTVVNDLKHDLVQQSVFDSFKNHISSTQDSEDDHLTKELGIGEYSLQNESKAAKISVKEENSAADDENLQLYVGNNSVKNEEKNTTVENIVSPPSNPWKPKLDDDYDQSLVNDLNHREIVKVPLSEDKLQETDEHVTVEVDSPSSSESSEVKPVSPLLSRLRVFEELRPKILRSTSLKTGKTPPGTPSKKKIVRFADVLGLDLEDVRHILTEDIPVIPSSAYTDLDLKDIDLSACAAAPEKVEINRRDTSTWQSVQGVATTNALYLMFSIPGEQPDFWDRVRRQGICLESVLISERNVQCTCRVMNYGFHKKVVARYSVNNWLSSTDVDASYVTGSSNGETDVFAFSIFLSPMNKILAFALKYEVSHQEYWDNNNNQNYCFSHHGGDQSHSMPSPVWQHEFW